jgi:ribose/xylose/arabinose/galactoside ABC-type transport system permease subunit
MATTTASPKPSAAVSARDVSIRVIAQTWSWLFLIGLIVFFSLMGPGFFTIRNFGNILVSSTLIMLMALGQTYVIITSGIDLSIGWIVGLASVVCARVMRDQGALGMAVEPAIALGVISGLSVALIPGLINGLLIAKIKVPPFIATLGMFGIVRGAAFLLTDGQNVVADIPSTIRDSLRAIGNGSLLYSVPGQGVTWFRQPADLTNEQLRSLERLMPYPVIIVAVVVIVLAFILARTQFGRHTYAIGGNAEASRRAGINVDRHLILIYLLSALTAGMAGIMHVFRYTAGAPNSGEAALLDSVAAVVIGGASLFGGEGKISGTVIGALIIAVLQTGLVILRVDALWQFIVVGCIIIIAVLVNQAQDRIESQRGKAGA